MKRFNKLVYEISKRYFEIIFSIFIILFCIPLFIVLSLLIKLSSRGPIFFKQTRIGKDKKLLACIKFRTISKEADDILNNLILKDK